MEQDHSQHSAEEWEDDHRNDKHHKKNNSSSTPFSPTFHFKEFKVGNLENASTINIGNNYPSNFKGFKRHNQGLGNIDGDHNDIHDLKAHMNQRYLIDALMENKDELPQWVKELLKQQEIDIMEDEDLVPDKVEPLYEKIRTLLDVEETPSLFLKLSKKSEVLEKVWTFMSKKWASSQEFIDFYVEVLNYLNQITFPNQHSTTIKLEHDLCKKLADAIEEQAKTLLVITYLTHALIPGYISTLGFKVSKEKLSDKPHSAELILESLREAFHLSELPQSIKRLAGTPEILKYLYLNIILPTIESNETQRFHNKMKKLLMVKVDESHAFEDMLTPEERGFLITYVIESLHNYPNYLFLEFTPLPLCE